MTMSKPMAEYAQHIRGQIRALFLENFDGDAKLVDSMMIRRTRLPNHLSHVRTRVVGEYYYGKKECCRPGILDIARALEMHHTTISYMLGRYIQLKQEGKYK